MKVILNLVLLIIAVACTNMKNSKIPHVDKKPKQLTIHNHTRTDDYYWLRERENPDVIAYLESENAYTKAIMEDTEELQKNLYDEMVGRIKQTDMSVPYKDNGYFYYTKYTEGSEYPIYCRKKETLEADEQVILDVNILAEGKDYCQVSGFTVSPNNKMLAYGIDTVSRRQYTLRFINIETGEHLPGEIENTTGGATWATDNNTLFYTNKDPQTLRHDKVLKFKLSESDKGSTLVYQENDDTFYTGVYKSKSKEYIFIYSDATLTSEYRFIKADKPDADFQLFQKRERAHEYSVSHLKDKFIIKTNWEAKNFRLMETPIEKPEKENWKEVIPHREDVLIESFLLFSNYLVIDERKNGLTDLRIINHKSKTEHFIEFNDPAYTTWFSVNPEFDTDILRIGYTSLTTPNSTYDYNMVTKERELLKQQEVLGEFNADDYESQRYMATARDGVQVPISLVYKKGITKDGKNPLLLYGYGSYGHTIDPYFSSARLSLLDRGFIFAIAHIRGGEIMGRHWYEDGKLLNKKNTFNDFIDCAEFLINEKYTNPTKLYAEGGSAGGLLMGTVVNMRPDLFKAVIAAVPFVDVVTTMLDESIPLTTNEYDEWGNPNDKAYYDYILSYSPYDNVEAKDYPNMLVTTGLHDSQVQYWEPAKWVAKLRELKTDTNTLLLHTNMSTGHGGASGRFERYKEIALDYAFLIKNLD